MIKVFVIMRTAGSAQSVCDSLTAFTDPQDEGLELRNDLRFGVKSPFQLVYLVPRRRAAGATVGRSDGFRSVPCITVRWWTFS